jgi:hypothetical protein
MVDGWILRKGIELGGLLHKCLAVMARARQPVLFFYGQMDRLIHCTALGALAIADSV